MLVLDFDANADRSRQKTHHGFGDAVHADGVMRERIFKQPHPRAHDGALDGVAASQSEIDGNDERQVEPVIAAHHARQPRLQHQ